MAAGAAGQLASPAGSVGGRPAARQRRNSNELLVRGARGNAAYHSRAAFQFNRNPLRSSGGGLRRQEHQYAAALGGGGAGFLRFSGIQPRRFRRRGRRDAGSGVSDAGPVSG